MAAIGGVKRGRIAVGINLGEIETCRSKTETTISVHRGYWTDPFSSQNVSPVSVPRGDIDPVVDEKHFPNYVVQLVPSSNMVCLGAQTVSWHSFSINTSMSSDASLLIVRKHPFCAAVKTVRSRCMWWMRSELIRPIVVSIMHVNAQ